MLREMFGNLRLPPSHLEKDLGLCQRLVEMREEKRKVEMKRALEEFGFGEADGKEFKQISGFCNAQAT